MEGRKYEKVCDDIWQAGPIVGLVVGFNVGLAVGDAVGAAVGCAVGGLVLSCWIISCKIRKDQSELITRRYVPTSSLLYQRPAHTSIHRYMHPKTHQPGLSPSSKSGSLMCEAREEATLVGSTATCCSLRFIAPSVVAPSDTDAEEDGLMLRAASPSPTRHRPVTAEGRRIWWLRWFSVFLILVFLCWKRDQSKNK